MTKYNVVSTDYNNIHEVHKKRWYRSKKNIIISIILSVLTILGIVSLCFYLINYFQNSIKTANDLKDVQELSRNLTFTFHRQNEYEEFFNKRIRGIENSFLKLTTRGFFAWLFGKVDSCSASIVELPYIISNQHCSGFNTAEFLNGHSIPIEFIAESSEYDIAFYKFVGNIPDYLKNLPKLVFNFNTLTEGSECFLVGSACGSQPSMLRVGKIKSIEDNVITHSAMSLPGDSGSLLFNGLGEVIGLNYAVSCPKNFLFCYKTGSNTLCSFFEQSFRNFTNKASQSILACASHDANSYAISIQNVLQSIYSRLPDVNLKNFKFSNLISFKSTDLNKLCKK